MKHILKVITVLMLAFVAGFSSFAQKPSSCKVYLEDKVLTDVTVEDAIKWCEQAPPTVQCDDGKIYKLGSFQISYLTLKPFMSQDFGIGEGGFPIKARNAVKNGKAGDTIILKNATYTNAAGITDTLPTISVKFK
jgi:hypothetical protein